MRTPELVSRLSSVLMVAMATAADSRPAHSQAVSETLSNTYASHTLMLEDPAHSLMQWQEMVTKYKDVNEVKPAVSSSVDTGVGPNYTNTYIDELGNEVVWRTINGTNGIPPNNPNHRIDTTYVSTNGSNATRSQTAETSLPSDTYAIVTDGHKADPSVNKVYKAISIFRNSTGGGTVFPLIEIYLDAKDVVDHAKRKIIDDLPKGGIRIEQGQGFTYLEVGSDGAGRFIKFGIEGSKDRSEDGNYIIRRDSNGLPLGGTMKLSRRAFLSIVGTSFSGK